LILARLLLVLVPLAALEVAFREAGPFIPGNYDTGSCLTPRFREVGRGAGPLYFARDQHWTAGGHDLAARTMAE
jgi:hypothetical protein